VQRKFISVLSAIVAALMSIAAAVLPSGGVANAATGGALNDLSCQPTAAHPQPVLLLHGLGGDPNGNWATIGPALAAAGYCTFESAYSPPTTWPVYGLAPIDQGAQQIATQIDQILAASGASQIDLVGHSEGAFMSLYVPKVLGDAPKVHTVFAMAPPTHGTSFFGLVTLGNGIGAMGVADDILNAGGCGACADLVVGGAAVQRLNNGPIAQAGVSYTVLATRYDELVRNEAYSPATDTAFVREPGVTNSYVQDTCPNDPVGHVGLAYDSGVLTMIENALDPTHAAPVVCSYGAPL
jgi:triacylglycerol esterase/lipase EstA (alpha/beta hydrolase family)